PPPAPGRAERPRPPASDTTLIRDTHLCIVGADRQAGAARRASSVRAPHGPPGGRPRVQRIELATPAALSTTHAGGAVVPSDHLVALVVEPDGLAIHTGHFHSRDVRGEREGVLTVRVCG